MSPADFAMATNSMRSAEIRAGLLPEVRAEVVMTRACEPILRLDVRGDIGEDCCGCEIIFAESIGMC